MARWEKCPSYNICLIGRNKNKKKRERKNFHHLTCHATVHEHMKNAGVYVLPKIPEVKWKFHFGFYRPEYLGSPSIGLVRPKFAFPFLTNQFTALLLLCKEFGKGIENGWSPIPPGWPGLIESPRVFAYMKYPACNKYHIRALCPFLDFFGGNLLRLAKRDSRLAARGSGSQARKIASPLPEDLE